MSSEAILLTDPRDIRILYWIVSRGIDAYMEDHNTCDTDKVRAGQLFRELYQSVYYLDNPDA